MTATKNDNGSFLQVIALAILLVPIAWAGIFGFMFAALRYSFIAGIEIFDDLFETEQSKRRSKEKQS